MKTVVILGASGQLGTDLTDNLSQQSSITTIGLNRADFDALDSELSPSIKAHSHADYFINCVAHTNVEACEDTQELADQLNNQFAKKVADFCRENSIVLFHISTDYVFDGKHPTPVTEDHSPLPINEYGRSKLRGENAVRDALEKHFIFRVSSLFGRAGASGKGGNFVETMIRLASEGKSLKVVSDQVMSPTHTIDAAKAITHFITHDIEDYGTYHCCNSDPTSWYDFARTIFEKTNIDANLTPVPAETYKTKAKRPQYSVLDITKLSRYYQMPTWQQALDDYLDIKGYR